ncbi:MAG: methyltransferase domain-containing protein [Actinomycetia bacterium]|nr:methyltransferase domain-containing protein [Actinomycetes bacterium]
MDRPTRWVTDTDENHSQWYIERFRTMAAEGIDLGGEARLMDAMLPPRSRVLDAGCGPGRVGALLHERGHDVVGVDADPALIAAAREDHPGPKWLVADLAELDLKQQGITEPFAGALLAGNVMTFLAPGTETAVLSRVGARVASDGLLVVGFGVDRGYALADFDRHAAAAGLRLEHRFATWDLRPWSQSADFAVTVLRTGIHETAATKTALGSES